MNLSQKRNSISLLPVPTSLDQHPEFQPVQKLRVGLVLLCAALAILIVAAVAVLAVFLILPGEASNNDLVFAFDQEMVTEDLIGGAGSLEGLSLISDGEFRLTEAEHAFCEQLLRVVTQEAIGKAMDRGNQATYWTDNNAMGGSVLIDGRFCEFYVLTTKDSRTLFFRNTSGPDAEFPRERMIYQRDASTGQSVIRGAFYANEGAPVSLSKKLSLQKMHDAALAWVK